MKLRLLPVLVSLLVTTAVLFGGLFVYRSEAMEKPLLNIVQGTEGVERAEMDISSNKISLRLELAPQASLREIMQHIRTEGAHKIGNRALDVVVTNDTPAELDKWWSGALFEVAQAMETKQYAKIPEALNAQAAQLEGLQVATEMDDDNVYIRLTKDGRSKFVILPRTPARLGVWPNE